VGRTVPFCSSYQSRPPTRPANCALGMAWRTGALRGVVGELERRGGATSVVGPLVLCSNLHAWARPQSETETTRANG
jgi:hypothetical protein